MILVDVRQRVPIALRNDRPPVLVGTARRHP